MLNHYSLWKYIFIWVVMALAVVYAIPNLYPDDSAVQISGASATSTIQGNTSKRIVSTLEQAKIPIKSIETNNDTLLIRLLNSEDQLLARSLIKQKLGDNYVVALNLAATTPNWLKTLAAAPMKLGLDLSGGVHFLLEVDTDSLVKKRIETYTTEVKTLLRKQKIQYRTLPAGNPLTRLVGLKSEASQLEAIRLINKEFPDLLVTKEKNQGGYFNVRYQIDPVKLRDIGDYAIKQNIFTLRNRVDELGVSEPLVQRQGSQYIVVELPGVQDTAEAKRILGKTANLEFRLEAAYDAPSFSVDTMLLRNSLNQKARIERNIIISGDQVASAQSNFDAQTGMPQVNISLDSQGGHLINRATKNNIGRRMAVVFIEQKPMTHYDTKIVDGKQVEEEITTFKEERSIISLATIQTALGNSFRITGLESSKEASELALLLRAGSLAAPMHFVEERTVGPSLGKENIHMGVVSTLIGLALVLMFMVIVYRMFGLIANLALAFNLILLIALMSIIGATLTMPGIAGIVLTLGMAVDANVLIFSRIREELANGTRPQQAIHEGYDRAFISIFDANITTLLVGIILYAIGTGPIKGFAITLSIGILTSMFTAIIVSRSMVNLFYGTRSNLQKISI